MKNGKLQIGFIGCGGIAHQKHFPSLQQLGQLCDLVAFCDIVEERAVQSAAKYGTPDAKAYTDYLAMLTDESLDVVHILTPNVMHGEMTVAALEHGKHVMCEKPMAHTSADALKMIEAARKSGKKLTIGYQNRFREDAIIAHKASSAGELGEIYFAKAHAVRRRAVPTWGVFTDKKLQGGGPLIDIGTHALDLALWIMDNYKPVSVTGSAFYKLKDKFEGNMFGPWNPATFDVEDSAFGFIKMDNGATIYLESSWALNTTDTREASVTLCGTEGGAEMSGRASGGIQLTFNSAKHGSLFDESPQLQGGIAYFNGAKETDGTREARHWLEAILNDSELIVKPEQALVVTQILEAIYESARTGETVKL
ncbi:Gfo/Idh/MocA family protein [Cohnella faecalis]|uniref:Gfo/Idh/MocA family oxidoreductase n=1 Tax=Cohnella faecalis TaxID=2315694 RepID=A0A398CT26_9BACL|nr:Gfo/Idh/MocA family oxidoreductase [Cohnella faecalis]RIE02471.1 gfo/Idh/MocA family oxidoreductase [Cohnella faecalis]